MQTSLVIPAIPVLQNFILGSVLSGRQTNEQLGLTVVLQVKRFWIRCYLYVSLKIKKCSLRICHEINTLSILYVIEIRLP